MNAVQTQIQQQQLLLLHTTSLLHKGKIHSKKFPTPDPDLVDSIQSVIVTFVSKDTSNLHEDPLSSLC